MAKTLAQLSPGETGRITALSADAPKQQRWLELGFLPGRSVTAVLRSPLGDPTAYQVLDTVIALRKSDAELIYIE